MKLLMWFVKIVLIVLLVSSLTLLTTGLIVQSYAKSLLASFNIQWEGQPVGLMGMFQGALGGKQSSEGEKSGNTPTDQPAGTEEEKAPENSISVMGEGATDGEVGGDAGKDTSQQEPNTGTGHVNTNSGTSSNGEAGGAGVGGGSGAIDSNGVANGSGKTSGNGTNSSTSAGNDAVVVSPDDITGAKNKLPSEEKERIFTLLMNKLPQKEMQQISGAMEGGLTEQELREIEQVISKYLTNEEYENLMEVLQVE